MEHVRSTDGKVVVTEMGSVSTTARSPGTGSMANVSNQLQHSMELFLLHTHIFHNVHHIYEVD